MNAQLQFEFAPTPTVKTKPSRRAVIKRVFEKADSQFIRRYTDTLIEYGRTHEDFIAGEVTEVYEKRNGKLDQRSQKALGGLYQSLQREGVIEKTGEFRARNQGNASAVYRLKR